MAPPPKKSLYTVPQKYGSAPLNQNSGDATAHLIFSLHQPTYAPDMRILSSASDTYWESGGVYNCIINCVPVSDVAGPVIRQSPSTDCSKCPLVVASSLLLVLQSGIHCLTICAIQLLGQTSYDRI